MEDKLRELLAKIESSDLTDEQKDKMLAILVDELQAVVQPVLLNYVDSAKLEALANSEQKVTVEAFISLMKEAVANPAALPDLSAAMEQVLVEYETVMKEGGLL